MLFNVIHFSLLISTQPNILRSWNAYSVSIQFCRSCFKSLSLFFFFLLATLHGLWFFPDQGSNSYLLQWNRRVLTTGPPGKSVVLGFFFLLKIFWCGSFLKSFLNVLQYCLLFLCFDFFRCFCFDLLGGAACGISAPWPGIQPTAPCTGRWNLNH